MSQNANELFSQRKETGAYATSAKTSSYSLQGQLGLGEISTQHPQGAPKASRTVSPQMRFQVLSHAGLFVESRSGASVVCDPWIVGSAYWRAWWNYPPVREDLVQSLAPKYIYLTHIHWDHFHGPSLRRFSKDTPILVPKGHYHRIKNDLVAMGFCNVRELAHGESVALAPDLRLTSYQFSPFLDSAVVIEGSGVTLLNANDAKFMGGPLQQILTRHPRLDFVFRSHSSANGRLCFEVVDDLAAPRDDPGSYSSSFAQFAQRSGARYAVPFASNHCFLHRDVYELNDTVHTPPMVEDYFKTHGITDPELRVMVSGDAWSSENGFELLPENARFFEDRSRCIEEYRTAVADKLERQYARENRAQVTLREMERYFTPFFAAIPLLVKHMFKKHPVTFVLSAGERRMFFEVDVHRSTVRELTSADTHAEVLEIHTSAFVMKQCMGLHLFSHLPISKRVRYRVTKATKPYIDGLNFLFNLYEFGYLPLRTAMDRRALETWILRWREVLLYGQIATDVALGKGLKVSRYL
jgi:UDP-MurNAc hydroxylase